MTVDAWAHDCYCCGKKVDVFVPYKRGMEDVSAFLQEMELSASDVENFLCPHCGCFDRVRHIFMYFDALDMWRRLEGTAVLHMAPEEDLERRIAECGPRIFVKGDVEANPGRGVLGCDLELLPFRDNSFDFIVCNHVLEHVSDDMAALRELRRVLAPSGAALLQTPYSRIMAETLESPQIDTPEKREEFYGEDTHLRLYGLDLASRMHAVGFHVRIYEHDELLPDYDPGRWGVNGLETLLIAT